MTKIFRVRVKGYKTAIEFFSRRNYENFVDTLATNLRMFGWKLRKWENEDEM